MTCTCLEHEWHTGAVQKIAEGVDYVNEKEQGMI